MLDGLLRMSHGMNSRFTEGNHPYQIMTRLLEECGEVAKEVNHFEKSGTKALRHGEPSKEKLAGEIKDVLNALMQLTIYYNVEKELEESIEKSIAQLTEEGHIKRGGTANE